MHFILKTFEEIFTSLKNKFKKRTNIDVADGSVIDSLLLSTSEALSEAYEEIENSKNPHIYTNLKGDDIDKMALLINCPRLPNETDGSYLYRCMKWTLINESSNTNAIESALSNLEYSSNAVYYPYTEGTGSATIYIIPNSYDDDLTKQLAIQEVKSRVDKVVSPDSYVQYVLSTPINVEVYCSVKYANENTDKDKIKSNLEKDMIEHINSIAIGDYLSYGLLNRIGVNNKQLEYFTVTHILLDGELLTDLNIMQRIQTKFLYHKAYFNEVN